MEGLKKLILVVVVLFLVGAFFLIDKDSNNATKPSGKPIVALSTFSLYDISKHIAGDTMELVMILPAGTDPHSFEPTPKLMAKVYDSSLIVFNGAGLEPWSKGFDFKAKTIKMAKHMNLLEFKNKGEKAQSLKPMQHDHSHHHGHACNHKGIDPHYWLDIDNMILATNIITKNFIELIPSNKELYLTNQKNYVNSLQALDKEYKEILSTCQYKNIAVNHNAFSYLANKYNFNVESLTGLSSDVEPSPKDMARLIEFVNKHEIKTIFFEKFVSDKAIKSIATQTRIGVDTLQPIGNITADELERGLTYEDIMRENLVKLKKALVCN
jgi:zinc transport system substrate-binding protein